MFNVAKNIDHIYEYYLNTLSSNMRSRVATFDARIKSSETCYYK